MTFQTKFDGISEELIPMLKGSVDAVLGNIAAGARAHWINLAKKELHSTRGDYQRGIQKVVLAPGKAVITLVGVIPNLIEKGMKETDLHKTLLGPKVPIVKPGGRGKIKKKDGSGYYRAIPFRHKTPGANSLSMGSAYEGHDAVDDAKKLGLEFYKKAKNLLGTTSDPYTGKVKYGGRLEAGLAPKLKPNHAVDIYAGMIREEKTYEKATQSQYTTFRTISTDSPGWIRPERKGKHLAKKVADYVAKIAPKSFKAYVESL